MKKASRQIDSIDLDPSESDEVQRHIMKAAGAGDGSMRLRGTA